MSNLLRAQKESPFGWYYAWEKLNGIGEPEKDIESGLKQPDTIKVTWDQPDGGRAGSTRGITAYVVPDKGIFGAEYSLIYTIPDFKQKVVARLDTTQADHGNRLFDLFGQCLQGPAATKWKSILDVYPDETRMAENLEVAIKTYLEKVVEMKTSEICLSVNSVPTESLRTCVSTTMSPGA